MNRLFAYVILINVALLAVFILLDFVTWNDASLNLDSRIKAILATNGIYANKVTGIYSNYGIVQVGITVQYVLKNIFLPPQESFGSSINLPLIWSIVTIAVNLCLIWYLGIKKLNELTKTQKSETKSPQEQKIN